ncbi:MAG: 3-dehydroquinate synthase [Elusimicrobiota bacterium]|nr:3-dehydroquinate synthase [Endomicrobiia bacterium]MDW8164970.1 3-dehydroquinate synthase [Elusimicrobiota bacterium]
MKTTIEIKDIKQITVYLRNLESISDVIKKEIGDYTKLLIVTHKKLWNLYKDKFKNLTFLLLFLPEGEKIKSFEFVKFLLYKFLKFKIDRRSLIAIFGGGVLGDLVGFVVSVYMRGINYIQVPTTLLAMVDSSIGGKTGINLEYGKNLIGSFYQPRIIFCDISLLNSLPQKEIYNGLGEILKYSIINKKIFDLLNNKKEKFLLKNLIEENNFSKNLIFECIKTKLKIVKEDEKEKIGIREKLNLGHTIAHAIEASTNYDVYSHGEAVILGLVAESYLSLLLKILNRRDFDKILDLINFYIKDKKFSKVLVKIPESKIFEFIKYDKKFYKKNFRFALPIKIGKVSTVENISQNFILKSISFLKEWLTKR